VTELITFPDVESAAIDYLIGVLDTVGDTAWVGNFIPKPRPTRMVKVIRTGGPRLSLVLEQAQITYECWDELAQDAHDLAQMVRGLLWVMPDRYTTVTTYKVVDLGGPANLPDPDTALPRYTGTVLITTRGRKLDLDES
jgi:hypothetical protein